MSKIRINELARELEVKPGVIIDLLPELGVSDKKTHSSSLDDDVALQLRQRITGESGVPAQTAAPAPSVPASAPAAERHHEERAASVAKPTTGPTEAKTVTTE